MFTFMEDLFRLIAGPYVLPLPVRTPRGLDRFETAHITGNQLIVLVAAVALLIVAWFLINKTRLGLAWRATEQDFETASALPLSTINARDFGFPTSISIISMAVFGGLGTLRGAVLGSLALGLAPEIFRPLVNYRNLMYGALLVLMMRFQPSGLIGDGSFIWESLRQVTLRLNKPKAVSGGEEQ